MSAPVITSVTPPADACDVVLGSAIEIFFDQPIDPATFTEASFSLTGPGQSTVIDGEDLAQGSGLPASGREYIDGTFDFSTPGKAVFRPGRPLRPEVEYTVLIVGGNSAVVESRVANPAGEALAHSYQYVFKTGALPLDSRPPQSPLLWPAPGTQAPRLDPRQIVVSARKPMGNDLAVVDLIFPGEIDERSFNPEDLIIAIEPILNDPEVHVPEGLTATVTIAGNRMTIAWK